jgi:aminopeptidase-like protein
MSIEQRIEAAVEGDTGDRFIELITELYPFCRSWTGDGVRETLKTISRLIPLQVHEVPTGTRVFDWTVPQEWNISDGYIKDEKGERVVDFKQSNLHVWGYSVPVRGKMRLSELRSHLYSLPEYPDWIPLRTSYYMPQWGFSLSHNQLLALNQEEYEVCIDSSLVDGHMSYGEYYLPGETVDEILLSTHICHPSLCNDNLSGIAILAFLAQALAKRPHRYSYRFLFVPVQIGSITWLAQNEDIVPRIRHGLVLTSLGDRGESSYKKSRRGTAEIDRAAVHVLKHSGAPYRVVDFSPHGYDERQYCSPGFNMPVGCLRRSGSGEYPEYHTSADDLSFISANSLSDSYKKCLRIISVLEENRTYLNLNPKCEPQLGRRGLYRMTSDLTGKGLVKEMPVLWVLNQSDGTNSLLDIADRAGLPFAEIRDAANALLACDLLREMPLQGRESAK